MGLTSQLRAPSYKRQGLVHLGKLAHCDSAKVCIHTDQHWQPSITTVIQSKDISWVAIKGEVLLDS